MKKILSLLFLSIIPLGLIASEYPDISINDLQKAIKWFQNSPQIQQMMENKNLMNMLKKQATDEADIAKLAQELTNDEATVENTQKKP